MSDQPLNHEFIVLVCGGRHYERWDIVHSVLKELHEESPITVLIQGGAAGADAAARLWAEAVAGLRCVTVHADWAAHGKAAGPIRNQQMLDQYEPSLVVAFPGGRGTADMLRRALEAGIPCRVQT